MAVKKTKALYQKQRIDFINRVIRIIADYYNVPMLVFSSKSKYPDSVKVKQIARYLCSQFLNKNGIYYKAILFNNNDMKSCSMCDIGKQTGGRDQFVTYQALTYVKAHYDMEAEYKAEIDELTSIIFKSADFGGRRIISNFEEDGISVTITADKHKNVYCMIDTGLGSVVLPYDKMEVLYSIWQGQRRKKYKK